MSINLFMFLAIVGVGFGTVAFLHSIILDCKVERLQAELNKLKKDKEND